MKYVMKESFVMPSNVQVGPEKYIFLNITLQNKIRVEAFSSNRVFYREYINGKSWAESE